jgi:hypothetical protein
MAKKNAKKNAPPPEVPHQVDAHHSDMGRRSEHWSLHYHPQGKHQGELIVVDAVSDQTNEPAGVLSPRITSMRHEQRKLKPTSDNLHIADFPSVQRATAAAHHVYTDVKLKEPFPEQNCTDFVKEGVESMVRGGVYRRQVS